MRQSYPSTRVYRNAYNLFVMLVLIIGLLASTTSMRVARADGTADPVVTLDVPPTVPIGENLQFTVSFDNADPDPADTGYGPYIDLYLPAAGVDGAGAATDDGITFISATYLGAALTPVVTPFICTGSYTHPLTNLTTSCVAGTQVVILQLPFGSFTTNQPLADVVINARVSNLADLNTPLTITAQGGFMYGNDPLDNALTDPPIIGPSSSANTTPTLLELRKEYIGPEDETATGPNFPRRYRIIVDIADGQTITNFDVFDILPNNLAYLSLISTTPAGGVLIDAPTVDAAANPPNNDLVVRFASVTGTTADNDVEVVFEFYVPHLDANGNPVLPPATGDDTEARNEARAVGDWTPIDPRDAGGVDNAVADPAGFEHRLENQSIAIQKSVSNQNDLNFPGYTPGDTLEYVLNFQISDFFAFDQIVITDVLSDGLRLDPNFIPTLLVNGHGFALPTAPFDGANYDEVINADNDPGTPGTDGTTILTFRVSDELITRGEDGRMVGGCVPPTGTATAPPYCTDATTNTVNDGPTTGRIIFRAIIQENFTDTYPSGDNSVDQGDLLRNTAVIQGRVLSNADATTPTGDIETDDTLADVEIVRGTLSKSIYAINGNTAYPTPPILRPGDTVTYRIQLSIPSSDIEDLVLTDYLPLPVFDASEVTVFDDVISAAAPAAGRAKFGPAETFRPIYGSIPAMTTAGPSAGNTVTFTYGDYDSNTNVTSQVDILFTVTTTDDPFADGLFLTNQVRQSETSTNQGGRTEDAIVQIRLGEPVLRIYKGVVGYRTSGLTLGGISFTGPNVASNFSGGPIFDSTQADAIGASNLAAGFVDAGDEVRFAIVVQNSGRADAFDVRLNDAVVPGFVVPASLAAMDLTLRRGDGTLMTAGTDYTATLVGPNLNIELTDNYPVVPGNGALHLGRQNDGTALTTGTNTVIVTYDLVLDTTVQPLQSLTNIAILSNYAGTEGGADHTATDPTDDAIITVSEPGLNKLFVTSSEGHTSNVASPPNVAIGEIVRYRLALRIPEGTMPNLQLLDRLPAGLTFIDDGTARVAFVANGPGLSSSTLSGAGLNVSGNDATTGALPSSAITFVLPDNAVSRNPSSDDDAYATGDDVYFNLGTVINSDNDLDAEYIVVEFNALVDNTTAGSNDAGDNRDNDFQALMNGTQIGTNSNVAQVRIVEPLISVNKVVQTPATATGDAGDTITYRVTYSNASGANNTNAFDVRLLDTLPPDLTLNVASITVVLGGGATGVTNNSAGNTVDITIADVPPGGSVQVDYSVTVGGAVTPGQVINNTANITYTSLPGTNGTTVNPTGSSNTGAPGSNTGERTGSGSPAQNDYQTSDPASLTIFTPTPVKSLIATSEAHTSDALTPPRVAIGEIARFRLAVRLAESTATNFQLVDALPPGLTFLNDGSARVAFVSNGAGIASSTINPGLPGCANLNVTGNTGTSPALPSSAITCPLPASAIGGGPFGTGTDVTFSLGNLVNSDTDADDEFVVVELNALVDNTVAGSNDAGDTLNNNFAVRVNGVQVGSPSNTVALRVLEPLISNLNKVVLSPASATGDAGDTITYRITYSNATGATRTDAFDVRLIDTLPAAVTLNVASVTVTLGGGSTGITNNSAGNTVDVTIARVPPGGTVQIDYSVTLNTSVAPGQTIPNTANLTYTSLPGPNGTTSNPTGSSTPGTPGSNTGERDGSGGHNDYRASDPANVTVVLPTSTKSLLATSEAHTSDGSTPPTVAIGEIARFRLAVSVPEGTSAGFELVDALPTGMTFLNDGSARVAFVANGGGIASSTINPGLPGCANLNVTGNTATSPALPIASVSCPLPAAAISGGPFSTGTDVTFALGTIVNTDSDADSEFVVVDFNALVDNSVAGSNDAGDDLSNSFITRVNGAQSGATSNSVTVRVAEPSITNVDKTVQVTPTDAGDTVTYRVTYSNASGANITTAFDVRLLDPLPAGLTLNPASVNVTLGGGATGFTNNSAGNTVDVTIAEVPPGGTVQIDYSATVNSDADNGLTLTNTANVTYTSLPGPNGTTSNPTGSSTPGASGSDNGERNGSGGQNDYADSDPASFTLATPTIDKLTPSPTQYTIGETVTYDIRVVLPEGETQGLVVTDNLPNGLAYVSHSIVTTAGPNLAQNYAGNVGSLTITRTSPASVPGNSGEDVVLSFPTVTTTADNNTNNNAFLVRVVARVLNEIGNQNGTTLSNTAGLSYTNPNNGTTVTVNDPVAETVTVIEPVLTIAKTITVPPNPPDAGGTVTYQIVVAHDASSTSPAYDVVVTDPIPAGLINANVTNVSAVGIPAPSAEVVAGQVRVPNSADGSFDLPLGASVTITVEAEIGGSVIPGQTITNTSSVVWSTLDGNDPNERSEGDGTADGNELIGSGALNDYETNSSVSFTINIPDFTKALEGTSAGHTSGSNVTIGEVVTYALTVTLPEGNTPSLRAIDDLPVGLAYVAGSVSVDTTGFNGSVPAPTVSSTGGSGDDVTIDLGAINVVVDNDGTNNSFTIRLQALVLDIPANVGVNPPGQTDLTNSATLTIGTNPPVSSNDVTVTVVEPQLVIAKAFNVSQAAANDTVQITLVVTNTGTSTAFDVVIEDPLLNAEFSSVSEGSTPPGFTFATVPSGASTIVRYSGGSIAAGASVTFTFNATLAAGVTTGQIINNTATVTDASTLPGNDPNERNVPDVNASDTLNIVGPDLTLIKDDGLTTVTPGQVVVYTLTISNIGAAGASGVVITDTVPANTRFNAASSTPGWSCADGAAAGTPCTFTVGNLAAGANTSVQFALTIDNPVAAGVNQITNSASVADDGTRGADPTPANNSDADTDLLNAAPDLVITKTDGGITTTAGGVITYTLSYSNVGNQGATGVTISETVPANTTFNAGASTPGWSCTDGAAAGVPCIFTVGNLAAGASGSVIFAVTVNTPLPAGVTQINNTATIADDGNNGPDPTPGNNTASDTTPVNAAPDLRITKTDGGISTTAGGVITYTLSYSNVGTQDATGVTISETVPANSTFNAGASTGSWSCTDGAAAGTPCTFTVGNLAAGASGSVIFAVTVNTPLPAGVDQIDNTATIDDDGNNGPDPTPGNNTASDTTPVNAAPDLRITKTDGGISTTAGGVITYTLSYSNTGNQTATGVVITETVPANSTFNAGASTVGWSCGDGAAAGTPCIFNLGTVAVGSGGTVTFAVTVNTPLPAGVDQIDNTATIDDDGNNGPDPTPGNNTSSDTTPVNAAPDLTITKTDGGISTTAGGVITYTLSYSNVGNQGATGVTISETVPANTTFNAGASTPGWSCTDGAAAGVPCIFTVGNLAAGASGSVIFAVTVNTPLPAGVTQINNTATIADDGNNGPDPTPGNNTASDTTPVNAAPDLRITKTDGGISTTAGGVITYTLSYSNVGTQDATGVTISETVPANTTFNAGASTGSWSCTDGAAAGTPCTFTVGNLAAGASGSVIFAVTVNSPLPTGVNQIDNTATIDDDGNNGPDPTPGNNTASDTTPVNAAPDLTITKTDGGISTTAGGVITYTLSYSNVGSQDATGVTISETVPANSTFNAGASTGTWSCADGAAAGTTCTFNVGSLAVGASGSVIFAVTVNTPLPAGVDQIDNTATIADDGNNGPDPTPGNNTSSDDTPVNAAPDLTITKTDGGISTTAGGVITYTLVYTNVGNQGATGVTISETVPANATFNVGASTVGWSCGDGDPAGTPCTFTVGNLAAGASGSVIFAVTVDATLPAGVNQIDNTATIEDDETNGIDPTPGNNTSSDDTPVNATPDLTLVKDDGLSIVVPGQVITYTLTISNVGTQNATGVVITDTLPANTSFVSASNGGSAVGNIVTWPSFSLAAGASVTRTVTIQLNNPLPIGFDTVVNTATVTDDGSNGPDPTPANNSDDDVDIIPPDLAISKSDAGSTATPGSVVVYTLTYTNVGTVDATGVEITETVPANSTFNAGASTGSWSCTDGAAAGTPCTFTVGNLAAGASGSVTFAVNVDSPLGAGAEQLSNSVSISDGSGQDQNTGNNSASDTTPINAQPDLRISKTDGGVRAVPGGVITYTLVYTNVGTQDATGVTISETVPANTTFNAGASTVGWSCGDGAAAGTTCTFNVGSLAVGAGGSVTFAVTVNAQISGSSGIINTVAISDDGAGGADPTPSNNSAGVTTPFEPTAVTLVSFTAQRVGNTVVVRWETSAEINTWGFHLYRSSTGNRADAVRVTPQMILAQGRGQGGASYSWTDTNVQPGTTYSYWLEETETDGTTLEYGPARVIYDLAEQRRVFLPLIVR